MSKSLVAALLMGLSLPTLAETINVDIKGFAFVPAEVTVNAGDTVVWTNRDAARHDVASGAFKSSPLGQGDSFSHTFSEAGGTDYWCSFHRYMKGKVTAQ